MWLKTQRIAYLTLHYIIEGAWQCIAIASKSIHTQEGFVDQACCEVAALCKSLSVYVQQQDKCDARKRAIGLMPRNRTSAPRHSHRIRVLSRLELSTHHHLDLIIAVVSPRYHAIFDSSFRLCVVFTSHGIRRIFCPTRAQDYHAWSHQPTFLFLVAFINKLMQTSALWTLNVGNGRR